MTDRSRHVVSVAEPAALFVGSFTAWRADPSRPVATVSEPAP